MEEIDYGHLTESIKKFSVYNWNNAMLLQRCITYHMAGEPQELIDTIQESIERMKDAAEALDTAVDALQLLEAIQGPLPEAGDLMQDLPEGQGTE